jgi:hypothetical protein
VLAIAFAALIGVGAVAAAGGAAPGSFTLVHDGRQMREPMFPVPMRNEGSVTAAAPVASSDAGSTAATGTLALHAVLRMESKLAVCPAGTPSGALECYSREGRGVVPGLGEVSESYIFVPAATNPAECPGGGPAKILGSAAHFTVSGKGEIELVMAASQDCLSPVAALTATQTFTVTRGSGAYAGASGNGTSASLGDADARRCRRDRHLGWHSRRPRARVRRNRAHHRRCGREDGPSSERKDGHARHLQGHGE